MRAALTLVAVTLPRRSGLHAVLLVASLVAVLVLVLVAPAAGASTGHCGSIGPKNADTGLYNITAQRISCRKTRAILTRWYNNPHARAAGPPGWKCTTRELSQFSTRTTCRHGHFRMAFTRFSG